MDTQDRPDSAPRDAAENDVEMPAAPADAEHSGLPETPPSESDVVRKDMSYSPGSESETQQKQQEGSPAALDDDIDPDQVQVAPGTGGPDDVGEVDVDPDDLNLPGRE